MQAAKNWCDGERVKKLGILRRTKQGPDGVHKCDVYQSTVFKNSRHMIVSLSDMHEEPVYWAHNRWLTFSSWWLGDNTIIQVHWCLVIIAAGLDAGVGSQMLYLHWLSRADLSNSPDKPLPPTKIAFIPVQCCTVATGHWRGDDEWRGAAAKALRCCPRLNPMMN
jgi:hypothetical protein